MSNNSEENTLDNSGENVETKAVRIGDDVINMAHVLHIKFLRHKEGKGETYAVVTFLNGTTSNFEVPDDMTGSWFRKSVYQQLNIIYDD
jgi:hypothetical protein